MTSLPTFSGALHEIGRVPSIEEKYEESAYDKPITSFLEHLIDVLPHPDFFDRAFEFWWLRFVEFLELREVPIVLLVGLSNFKSAHEEYRFDDEISLRFYGERSLEDALDDLTPARVGGPLPVGKTPIHLIHGAIRVDFTRCADRDTLQHNHYSHECIVRMLPIENTLTLSGFGRLVTGPWLPILNPQFPVDGVRAVGSPEGGHRLDEPVFSLGDDTWQRFIHLYPVLLQIEVDEEHGVEANSAIRRRFVSAISRFMGTIEQGYWEFAVVDLVILMESLLTPERQGGRMPLAIAASNLLGTTKEESREVFEVVTRMYFLRNSAVHGEPSTEEKWNSQILEIAELCGLRCTRPRQRHKGIRV